MPPVNAEFLHERLPKSKLDLNDAGHFVWEDAADSTRPWLRAGGPETTRKPAQAPPT